MPKKVFVIGLDSVPPELLFEFLDELPNLKKLLGNGIYGKLDSCIPPITIPAWMVMLTSKNPGLLGLYGFRHRKKGTYNDVYLANSYSIKEATVPDILSAHGKKVCLVGVPPSYPPKPVNGCIISCILTPAGSEYTYPLELKREVEEVVGKYIFDVDVRDKGMLEQLYEMTERRFKVVKYLIKSKEWDFFMFVEIGTDRIHHAFWKSPEVIKKYYMYIDKEIGEILSILDDETVVIVVSDHGAKRMNGELCINEWLLREGYLVLKKRPEGGIDIEDAEIDWGRTKAWGWGGYHARIFLNVKGREPEGIIPQSDYEKIRDEISDKLKKMRDLDGKKMDNRVYKPEQIYGRCNGDPPDLIVYFDNLHWRSDGSIGHGSVYLPDDGQDAVHSETGIFIMYDPAKKRGRELKGVSIMDVAPTILKAMGIPVPGDMSGRAYG